MEKAEENEMKWNETKRKKKKLCVRVWMHYIMYSQVIPLPLSLPEKCYNPTTLLPRNLEIHLCFLQSVVFYTYVCDYTQIQTSKRCVKLGTFHQHTSCWIIKFLSQWENTKCILFTLFSAVDIVSFFGQSIEQFQISPWNT